MGKHKHEEHVNHERWLVSFADMMTLLFALFVVLYALSSVEMEKLKDLKKSVQFAFHIAGEGKTRDTGIFDQQQGGGEVTAAAPLVTAQDGGMREFLLETLPKEFEDVAGRSLDVNQTDDTVTFRAPLSTFFEPGKVGPIKPAVLGWFGKAVSGSLQFTSDITIGIEAPNVVIGEVQEQDRIVKVTSEDLCWRRLRVLRKAVLIQPEVREHLVGCHFRVQKPVLGGNPLRAAADWEERAQVIVAFSNRRAENR